MNDPLDDLLTPAVIPHSEALQRTVFGRTTRALRWRRRRRQVVVAAGVAALFVLALVPPPEEPAAPRRVVETVRITEPTDSPVALEWRALEQPAEATALFREAADRYLEAGDPAEALRCYANALDESKSLDVQTEDSWLLITIKHARKKELDR